MIRNKYSIYLFTLLFILASKQESNAQSYCTPTTSYGCNYNDYIVNFSTTGGATNINNTTGCNGTFTYFSSQSITATIGNSFNYSITNNPYYGEYYSMWIDFNRNGTFGDVPSEVIFTQQSISSNGSRTGSITIPSTVAVPGASRIRVRCTYGSSPTMTPCGYNYGGETEDYVINMNPACTTPVITAQPLSGTRCSGDTLSFSVAANTTNTYKWQVNMGSGFVNLNDGGIYSGTSTNKLRISNVPVNANGYMYRAVLAGTCPTSVNSNTATLVVANAVNLLSQTAGIDSTCEGLPAVLSVQAIGVGLTYQWQLKDANGLYHNILNTPPYSGANTDNLHIANVDDTMDQHVYRVLIFGSSSCVNAAPLPGNDITMAVKAAPDVTPSIISRNIEGARTADTFTVNYPSSRSYQWQMDNHNGNGFADLHDDATFSGTNTEQLIITDAPASFNGNTFRCLVEGSCSNGLLKSHESTIELKSTSIAKTAKGSELTVYPNPAVSNITLGTTKPWTEKMLVRITDKTGKTVINDEVPANTNNYIVNVKGLASGIYTVEVGDKSRSKLQSQQFTKQ